MHSLERMNRTARMMFIQKVRCLGKKILTQNFANSYEQDKTKKSYDNSKKRHDFDHGFLSNQIVYYNIKNSKILPPSPFRNKKSVDKFPNSSTLF